VRKTTNNVIVTRAYQSLLARRSSGAGRVVAVTGGAGFIGSHLCEALVDEGCEVVCIDNFQTGSMANLTHLQNTGRFATVRHDVMRPLPKNLPKFDEIYNFACPASPVHYQADRVNTALTCALGALNVLERAERDNARVLQASTSEVYGDPDVHPQPEAYRGQVNPVGPRACYDEGKRFAETLFTDYGVKAGLRIKIVRIFNTYGPRMQVEDGRVVSNFVVQALSGRDITLYGDGRQTRSFCYVDDLVDGCRRLMASPDDQTGPVNLGNPTEITVAELAETVLELTGSRSRIVFRPLPVDDPRRRKPDITLAETRLGWSPRVPLRDGLERTIESFVQRLNATPEPVRALPARV
jgi:UDP-glucuronate decarboxylase